MHITQSERKNYYASIYPQCLYQPFACSAMIECMACQNASYTDPSTSSSLWWTTSRFERSQVLMVENANSIGLKSGEYGGRNSRRALCSSTISWMPATL